MRSMVNENDETVEVLLTNEEIRMGNFISNAPDRQKFLSNQEYLDVYYSTDEEEVENPKKYSCRAAHGFAECVTKQYPIDMAHRERDSVFEDAITRVDDNDRLADSFDKLPPSKQHWCMYWWHCINVFQVKGQNNRQQLPNCFLDMVQVKYPNPKGEFFTGYKRGENAFVCNA